MVIVRLSWAIEMVVGIVATSERPPMIRSTIATPRVLRQIPGPVSIAPGQADEVTEHDRERTVVEGVELRASQHR